MKLVCISDTHEMHGEIKELPEGDILIHAGDFTGRGSVPAIGKFNNWLGTIKHRYKNILVVAGNHDKLFESDPALAKSILTNATYLQDSGIEIDGVKFWGSPWTNIFSNWSFMDIDSRLKQYWDMIPNDTNVLITHGPPNGFMDEVMDFIGSKCEWEGRHTGSLELLKAIERVKPKVHIFGHIHEGYGTFNYGSIKLVNASTCDGFYRPYNSPIVVDL
jgi:Icc-related predicted phosphoesterase